MIKELGFDAVQKLQILTTSLQLPGPYRNLKVSYALGNGGFPAGDREAVA